MPARHLIRSSALLLAFLLPRRSVAQSTTSLLTNATVLPRHSAAFRLLSAWTRYDELLGQGEPRNIASGFTTDSLGSAQIPQLGIAENQVRALSGLSTFTLTAGKLVSVANSRVVTAPLIAEYGLTSRITIGVAVPLVETRTTVFAQLNPTAIGVANVGPNPALATNAALSANEALVTQLRGAAKNLQTRLADCQTTPTGTGCTTLLGQQSAIQSLLDATGSFASGVEALYGTSAASGQPFVPIAGTLAQLTIDAKLRDIQSQYQNFLGTSGITGALVPAGGPGARTAMQALMAATGRDSIRSTDRASIGDISVGATLQLANNYGDTTAAGSGGLRYRLAVNGTVRIGTGQPANTNRLFDIGTGTGQQGLIGGIAADVQLARRVSATVVGSYLAQLGTVDVARVPGGGIGPLPLTAAGGTYSPGNVLSLAVNPRYRLGGFLAVTGSYTLLHVGADRYTPAAISVAGEPAPVAPLAPFGADAWTAHQVGVGFSYSTIVGPDRGPGRLPVEVAFSHLETLAASGGPMPKTFRDQMEVRVFLR